MTRSVLISGAAGGIGRATALRFAEDGWDVVAVDRVSDPEGLPGRYFRADVADPDAMQGLFATLESEGLALDAVVNNAAIQVLKTVLDTTPAEWDAVLATNVRSAYLVARGAVPLMRERGGAIVNVSSVHALATSPSIGAYATSKGALLAFTRALALELAPAVRVNAVLPGAVDTSMLREGLTREAPASGVEHAVEDLGARTPAGRVGRPREIAEAILFLADGERSSFITGQSLVVDGGATARLSTE